MKLLRETIRQILLEDIDAFWKDWESVAQQGKIKFKQGYWGGDTLLGSSGKEIKKLFRKHADHKWFKLNVNTVHWGEAPNLMKLVGRNKDEFSCSMSLKGKPFPEAAEVYGNVGLWLDGWITLAANDQDDIVSGYEEDYKIGRLGPTPEKYKHRKASSGINKYPQTTGHRNHNYPSSYVLDADTFDQATVDDAELPNEALVDNWQCVGVVVGEDIGKTIEEDWPKYDNFEILAILRLADIFGQPIYRMDGTVLRYPGEMDIDDAQFE